MISKNEAKYIQTLYHKKTRESEGVFVAEGPKIVGELLASGYVVQKVYATDDWIAPKACTAELVRITQQELERISGLQAPNQVLAIAQQQPMTPPLLQGRLSLVLDAIQDPGNLGTIIRIADWFGITQLIASTDSVELYNPKVIQSTMGSFLRVNIFYTDITTFLREVSVPVYGALLNGKNVFTIDKVKEGLLVIGNESKGISEAVQQLVTVPVTIPRMGGAESLNAAVATGIIISHLVA